MISISGTGYVGLVTGVCFAEVGHKVICVDIDNTKVSKLKQNIAPIFEQGLEQMMKKNYSAGLIDYTTDYRSAYKNADVIFIGVGTPELEDGSPNLSCIYDVAKQIAQSIENDCLVVIKSTVPIGTNEKIEEYMNQNLIHTVSVEVASNPEFLSQGTAIQDTLNAKRIVIGTESTKAENTLKEIYAPFNIPIVSTNRKTAEMIKYACNDFLALKISFMNDIANLCEIVGANIEDVATGMSFDDRIGNKFLNAGIGYGGSCFPKDTKALHWLAKDHGYQLKTIKAAIDVNEKQKLKLIEKSREKFSSFDGLTVAALGLTFKPNTDDLREAPSIKNIEIMLKEGAHIKAYDPIGMDNFKKLYPTEIDYKNNIVDTLSGADVCFIFTEWDIIKQIQPAIFKDAMKTSLVYDGRNCYDVQMMKDSGIEYYSIGRCPTHKKTVPPSSPTHS